MGRKDGKLSDRRFNEIVGEAWKNLPRGTDCEAFSAAVGALAFGRLVGWQGVRCVHSHPRYQKFQKLLGVRFADVLPDRTEQSKHIRGIKIADGFEKFWQAVACGAIKVTEHREKVDPA